MTDHSILRPSAPDLPFQEEARVLTNVLRAIFVEFPAAFRRSMAAQSLYNDLYILDSVALSALGLHRDGIGRYTLEKTGIVGEK